MKKVLMSVALVSAIAIAAGYSMIVSDKIEMSMSDLAQNNVEALADDINGIPDCVGLGWECDLGGIIFHSKQYVEVDD